MGLKVEHAYMALVGYVEYKDAGPEVRAVYDDIMKIRWRPARSTRW